MTMTSYFDGFNIPTFLQKPKIDNTLSEILSKNKMCQLKIAETEKYAHVTYFFNGGKEVALDGEERIMLDSPRVAQYSAKHLVMTDHRRPSFPYIALFHFYALS